MYLHTSTHTYVCTYMCNVYYTIPYSVCLSVYIVHSKQKIQFSFSFIQNSNNSQSERVFALLDFISLGCGFVFLSHCDLYPFALFLFPFVCCSLLIHFQIYLYTNIFICTHIHIFIYINMLWLHRSKQICLCSLWLCIFYSRRGLTRCKFP